MSVETEHREKAAKPGFAWGVVAVAVLLFAYPLSTGPALKLCEKGVISPSIIEVLYAPLDAVLDRCPSADKAFDWYWDEVWKIGA